MSVLVPRFTVQEMEKLIKAKLQNNVDRLIRAFEILGQEAVNEAVRAASTPEMEAYTDRTGNLRNSSGYVVAVEGEIVAEMYRNEYAKELAEQALSNYPDGIVLIVVAGMQYAAAVESLGYNVLTSAEMYAEKRLPELLKLLSQS